ncbi:unnamed protein product [Boreogadus saida]
MFLIVRVAVNKQPLDPWAPPGHTSALPLNPELTWGFSPGPLGRVQRNSELLFLVLHLRPDGGRARLGGAPMPVPVLHGCTVSHRGGGLSCNADQGRGTEVILTEAERFIALLRRQKTCRTVSHDSVD